MIIIPAIDLREGKAVQLVGGDFSSQAVSIADVESLVASFFKAGIRRLHVVDLDAAKGNGNNLGAIKKILKEKKGPVEVGGGIRSFAFAKELIDAGADFLIIGTKAVLDDSFLSELSVLGKEKLIVCLDYKQGKVVTHGWDTSLSETPLQVALRLQGKCGGFLLTCVDVEGKLNGPDLEYLKEFTQKISLPVIASGGIASLEDLTALSQLGVAGAVVGMALYTGKINLEEAINLQNSW